MGILNLNRFDNSNQPAAAVTTTAGKTEKKVSDFWLNVGITLKGAGEDGADIFVSLPVGIALDDMKPQAIRGSNQNWIHLAQVKNQLLADLQEAAAGMEPGDRACIPQLSCEVYRRAEPAQQGDAGENPLLAALSKQFKAA